ncbi:probable WRKY transcription factor protein 1 [Temnothorax curvispinosus]|uniref:Probable WRKY transcription factor protein 1 n=1 Tax=Temnothorax curvispinosus TaxID=300111 RepID=A0A6J1RDW1_9HYME|nr:probable WRKY transcription factor protein 1 [Temnothorax curvispinosus]
MDHDKYYKLDKGGTYTVHFYNKDRLDTPEIKEAFSSYGKVVDINFGKEDTLLTFVKLGSLKETIACLDGFKDSNIEILPERSKIRKRDNRDSSQQQAFQKTFNNDKKLNKNLPNARENSPRKRTSNENNRSNNFTSNQKFMPNHGPNSNVRGSESDLSVFNEKSSLFSKQQISKETNSSDTTIDYRKYYRLSKDDTYTIHFANRKGLEMDEIEKLCSPYGNIVSIYPGGENNGLRFVKYKTQEEVIRCIKGLRDCNVISLLPQKDKIMTETKTTDQRSLNSWQTTASTEMGGTKPTDQGSLCPWEAARTEDTSQRTFSTGKQFNSNSIHNERSPENGEKSNYNTKTSGLDKLKDTDYSSDTASRGSRQSYKFNENKTKYKKTSPQMSNEQYSFSRQQNPMSNKAYDRVMREKQQETKLYPSTKTETDIKMDKMRAGTHDHNIPALISDTETKLNESDTMHCHMLSGTARNALPELYQEIIVANIHTNYGVHYILHLFEKYGPISATLVKTIPENDLRYCHVFFKTVQDAVAVEKEFDNFHLAGKNLIVLQRSRLVDGTICK